MTEPSSVDETRVSANVDYCVENIVHAIKSSVHLGYLSPLPFRPTWLAVTHTCFVQLRRTTPPFAAVGPAQ